ncbi:helix-turn-helix transcriptional regulator [Paenibacillus qinlingensis]|uniref:AraC-like DNA-binding protein n=1 Tax=Paenibacillus qinlingensis TaxID=1837343 RepID=A0ABU1NWS0_9BACL|nr:helix-turn-helix transcriptional regulator [Paenibacillus qinlingensis]MDR6551903.1 AraC-like DNA-binding protein [Paenibacillus qinlingensis]
MLYEAPNYDTIHIPNMDSAFKIYQSHWRKTLVPWWTYPLNFPIFELNVLLEGVQDVQVGDQTFEMLEGDLLIIKPGMRRQIIGTREKPITYFTLHFDVEDYMLRTILIQHRSGLHRRDSALEREIRVPFEQLIHMLQHNRGQDMRHPAIRLKLISQLFSLFAILGSFNETPAEHGMDPSGNIIAYRMAEQIELAVKGGSIGARTGQIAKRTITLMADELGYSPSYCYRVFRRIFGMSPQAYMSNMILHQSRLELNNTEQSLDQIAAKLGFQDGLHFSKQFKRWTGCSPTAYRRKHMEFQFK